MSVLSVPSPVLAKRHFDEGEAGEGCDRQFGGKRTRQHYSPSAARCVQSAAGGLHAVPPTTLSALLALFPGMDERTVSNVLSECGNNIDAAIRRLGELRLSTNGDIAGAEPSSGLASGHSIPHRPAVAAVPGTPSGSATAAAAAAAATPVGPSAGNPGSSSGADDGLSPGPMTAEQWVDVLVGEMSAASDLSDARQRAAGFLRQFESFISRFLRQQQAPAGAGDDGGGSAHVPPSPSPSHAPGTPAHLQTPQQLAARAAKLAEENAVLKKAVQIQHRQLQERAGQEAEVAQLKAMLAQYQEQVRTLQISNYSLSLHLQKATDSGLVNNPRNPDVF